MRKKPEAIRLGNRPGNPHEPVVRGRAVERPPMGPDAAVAFERLLKQARSMRVMTPADAYGLAVLAELLVAFRRTPTGALAATIRNYLVEFGLTPASRPRLVATPGGEPPTPAGPFGDL